MKTQIFFILLIIALVTVPSNSMPHGMTRIQQVLRTLMGNKPGMHHIHARGKKLFPDKAPIIEAMEEDIPVLQYPYEGLNNDRIFVELLR